MNAVQIHMTAQSMLHVLIMMTVSSAPVTLDTLEMEIFATVS